jgi:hypothetical protein
MRGNEVLTMKRTFWSLFVLLALVAIPVPGQDTSRISGPVLGYVFDADNAGVRPIFGIPGAATLGPALNLGVELDRAALSQESDYLLGVAGPDRQVVLFQNLSGVLSPVAIAGAAPAPDRILASPTGRSALLLYRDSNVAQVLTGLPDAPALGASIDLSGLPPLKSWGISDDGRAILASAPNGDGESVFLINPDGSSRLLLSAGRVAAAAFLTRRSDTVIADALYNSVDWIRDVTGAAEVINLAAEKDGISSPVAVSVSADNLRVFVANAGSGTIATLDLAGGAPLLVPCECALTGLERLQGNAVFRLTEPAGEPLWVFDGDPPQARIVFVPAARNGGEK